MRKIFLFILIGILMHEQEVNDVDKYNKYVVKLVRSDEIFNLV